MDRDLTLSLFTSGWSLYGSAVTVCFFLSDAVLLVDVGKAGRHLDHGAEIGRQHKSHSLSEYEILIGNPSAVHWVDIHGVPGARHVEAGIDAHGHQILIAQVSHNGGIHPARANSGTSGMFDFLNACVYPPGI
jgi:hypothetical protein